MLCPVGRECSRSDCSTRRGGSRLRGNLCCISIQKIALPVLGHREPWETDYSPTAKSRVTHAAQWVVFGACFVFVVSPEVCALWVHTLAISGV